MSPRLFAQLPALTVVALATGCSAVAISSDRPADRLAASGSAVDGKQTATLTISAAASLQTVLSELEPLFEAQHPEIEIFYNWGGSGTLQRQIEQGAPADIFFSASVEHMEAIAHQGKLNTSVRSSQTNNGNQSLVSATTLLTNRLVLIAPVDSPLTQFEDLAKLQSSDAVAVGDFISVPAGQYAEAAMNYFNLLPELTSQLVFFNNVRGVLAAVESGHAAAGFVYLTDAQLSERVRVIATAPAQSHPSIRYPVAVLQRSPHPEAAQTFIDFLSGPAATEAFKRHGFETQAKLSPLTTQ